MLHSEARAAGGGGGGGGQGMSCDLYLSHDLDPRATLASQYLKLSKGIKLNITSANGVMRLFFI